VDFLGYRLIAVKGHLNAYISPKVIERFRDEVRRRTRRTAGVSFAVMTDRLNDYLRVGESTSNGHNQVGCWIGSISG
jgi:hypothetical protein